MLQLLVFYDWESRQSILEIVGNDNLTVVKRRGSRWQDRY